MSSVYRVVIVGAGEINFGSPEGPWNHSARLEQIFKNSNVELRFVALVDPNVSRATERIKKKCTSNQEHVQSAWQSTKIFPSIAKAALHLEANGGTEVDLVILGCPPYFRGTLQPGKRVDVEMLEEFSKAKSFLVEKPVAAVNPFLNGDCDEVASRFAAASALTSVGYMLRYSKAILKIRAILQQHGLTPTCVNARYFMAYEYARKLDWWNKSRSCGPVVEQATHFIDLIRFLAGESNDALLDSVRATTVLHIEPVGVLSKLGFDKSAIPAEERVPRVTSAFWKHEKGTIGTLSHGITLHGMFTASQFTDGHIEAVETKCLTTPLSMTHASFYSGTTYDTEIEVLADGWILRVRNAYDAVTTLSIRSPGQAEEQIFKLEDDPFLTELQCLVRCTRPAVDSIAATNAVPSKPLSPFEDALKTYKLSWKIRLAAEETAAQ